MPPAPQFDPLGASVAGSGDLQSSIDRLNQSVLNLTTAVQGQSNGNGTTTSPALATQAQGATFTNGTFGAGNNGSGGTAGTNPFTVSGSSGLPTAGSSGAFSATQILGNLASSAFNATAQAGNAQVNNQVLMNTYGYVQAGFWNTNSQSTIQQNFGNLGGGGIATQNNMATSATDAFYGGNLLSQMSGQANYTAASGPAGYGRGNAAYQAASVAALANPGLGMTGSASVSGALYNPNTSYNLMMMGVNTTPLQMGTGKSNSLANVESAIGQRFNFGGYNSKTGTFNSQSLAANLDNPLFQYQMMQATGMNQQQFNEWSQTWAQANTWTQNAGGGVTMNQMQNQIAAYMNGGTGQGQAQSWLTAHGVSQSALQQLTQSNAGQTATESGTNQSFINGLSNATIAINKLTNALARIAPATAGVAGSAGGLSTLNALGVSGAGGGGLSNSALATVNVGLQDLGNGVTSILSGLGISSGSSGVTAVGGNASGSNAANEALGKKMAAARGWTGAQWTALNNVAMQESGWDDTVMNAQGSGAAGIAQNINGWGPNYQKGNAEQQIAWMLNYIAGRYGTPEKAWQHEQADNWYATGTNNASPGMAMVGERGPELIRLSGGQQIMNAAKTAQAVQAPWTTGQSAEYLFSPITGTASAGISIAFNKGAITLSTGSGYHTSNDVNTQAQQFVQALEKALMKSDVLHKIAAGVTG